jgi:hypothetical protein
VISSGQGSEGRRQRKTKALTGPLTPAASNLYAFPVTLTLYPRVVDLQFFLPFLFGGPVFQEYKGLRIQPRKLKYVF